MASTSKFDPEKSLGSKLTRMPRRQLYDVASKLCAAVIDRTGGDEFRGGIYPENISLGEDGAVALGPVSADKHAPEELGFMAPELFWDGKKTGRADVFSIGMLLYYAVSGGKLPFEDEDEPDAARARRHSGEEFAAPESAGRRLGEIIRKATAYNSAERYPNVTRLKADIDACTKYMNGDPEARAGEIFNKEGDALSELEKMMLAILASEETEPEPVEEEITEEAVEPVEEEPAEEEPAEEEAPAEAVIVAEEEPIEEPESEEIPEEEPTEENEEEVEEEPAPIPMPIPQLREEPHPELEPIVVKEPPRVPPLQYEKTVEREKKIAEKVRRRRRRPFIFIFAVCVLIVLAALIYGKVSGGNDKPTEPPSQPTVVETPTPVEPTQSVEPVEPTETAAPVEAEHRYQLFVDDVSWEEAAELCRVQGGYLVTINDEDEFNKVTALADSYGIRMVWVGAHRVDGAMAWESGETVEFYRWDIGEPSYSDSYDGATEDFMLLWNHGGWVYNDSRNDPLAMYYDAYSGKIAYICEYDQ